MIMKTILSLLIAIALVSCSSSKFETGTYRVSTVKHVNGNSIVRFEGYNREFVLPTDTLKKGDLVYFVDPGVMPTAETRTAKTD
jgi:hypothetical protein